MCSSYHAVYVYISRDVRPFYYDCMHHVLVVKMIPNRSTEIMQTDTLLVDVTVCVRVWSATVANDTGGSQEEEDGIGQSA